MYALISVTDKTGIEIFGKLVSDLGWHIISTGGTAETLKSFNIPYIPVGQFTGFPEILNGRVKTLHPHIFGGILADRNKPEHMEELKGHGLVPIELVVVNLYDFDGKPGIESIDIGGPSLIRAAAKNGVPVLTHHWDYNSTVKQLLTFGHVNEATRAGLAAKAFELTARYDAAIAKWFRRRFNAQ